MAEAAGSAGQAEGSTKGVVLVTGANRGIGREAARQLAELGYEVLVSARQPEDAESAALAIAKETGGRASALTLDVSEPSSISAAAERVHSIPGRLDVLINNAGVGLDWGVSGTEPDFEAMERELQTNFYGAWRLAVAVLDLLRESDHPRIVNVSSGMGGVSEMGGWSPGYRVSKAALNAMTRILSTELRDAGILVNSACPGLVATDMGAQFGARKSVHDGAAGLVWLATLPDDGPTGGFFRDGRQIAF